MNNIFELADKLRELRDRKKELDEQVKENNAEIEATETALAEAMIAEEMQNFTRSGMVFCLTTKVYASANPAKKPELFEALKDQGYGSLVYETVNANSLSAFVKEQMEQNDDQLPEWLEGLINTYEKTTVSMRRGK